MKLSIVWRARFSRQLTAEPSDEQFAKLFRDLQLPVAAFQAFRERVASLSLVAQSGASEWIQALFAEFLEETWFRMPEQSDITRTHLGSRPGDGLVDVMFFFLFAEVLQQVRSDLCCVSGDTMPWASEMRDNVLAVEVSEAQEHVRLGETAWMDDLCVMEACACADAVVSRLTATMGSLVDRCVQMGMSPNLGPNKTEAVLGLRGPHAREVRRAHFTVTDLTVSVASRFCPEARVRVVTAYRHLGGILHQAGRLHPEARARAACGWAAFQRHRKTVFCHGHVALREKVSLFQTLVLSAMLYGSGTWCELPEDAIAPLRRAYVGMARAMFAKHYRGDVTHLGLPPLGVWFHCHRLTYLASFVTLGVKEMWAL